MEEKQVTFLLDEKLITLLSLCHRKGIEIDRESIQECIKELELIE